MAERKKRSTEAAVREIRRRTRRKFAPESLSSRQVVREKAWRADLDRRRGARSSTAPR